MFLTVEDGSRLVESSKIEKAGDDFAVGGCSNRLRWRILRRVKLLEPGGKRSQQ